MKIFVIVFAVSFVALVVAKPQGGVELQFPVNPDVEEFTPNQSQNQLRSPRGSNDVESWGLPDLGFSQNQG